MIKYKRFACRIAGYVILSLLSYISSDQSIVVKTALYLELNSNTKGVIFQTSS